MKLFGRKWKFGTPAGWNEAGMWVNIAAALRDLPPEAATQLAERYEQPDNADSRASAVEGLTQTRTLLLHQIAALDAALAIVGGKQF